MNQQLWLEQLEACERFKQRMIRKLSQNRHKGDWRLDGAKELIGRLKDELVELEEVLESANVHRYREQITDECADIANFAMFIADNCGDLRT